MNNKGFTLLELILCISLFAIILTIPLFKIDVLLNQKEKKELKEFITDINYARNKAIIESTRYSIYIRPDTNSYVIYQHKSSMQKIVKKKEFTNGIQFKSTNVKDKEIIFTQSGAPSHAGEILLKNKRGEDIKITITPATGKVNIYYNK